jgi:hypothetical protein
MLKELAAAAPAAGSLPAEQKAFADQLAQRQAELNKARERYAAATDAAAAEADGPVKDIEAELAAAQAKVDERKKQIADAAKDTMSAELRQKRAALTDARKHDLEAAQKSEQAAAVAYQANRRAQSDAALELEKLKKGAEAYERENASVAAMTQQIQALNAEVGKLHDQLAAAVVPVAPGATDVKYDPDTTDNRKFYCAGVCAVLGVLFFCLVHAAPLHPHAASDEDTDAAEFPFADTPIGHGNGNGDGHGNGDGSGNGEGYAPSPGELDEPSLAAAAAVEAATERAQRSREASAPVGV